jgi:phosphopantothenate synthetase
MSDTIQHEVAESLFERNLRRETEINEALKLEAERHGAAVRDMHRLSALRSARDAKSNNE